MSEHCPHMGRVWSNILTHLFITWMVWKYRLCDIMWHLQISHWMLTLWSFSFPLPFHTKALQVQRRFSCPYALVHALLLACKRQKHEFLSKPTETAARSGPESTTCCWATLSLWLLSLFSIFPFNFVCIFITEFIVPVLCQQSS